MQLGNVLEFKKDLYFEGAVQADWFYNPERSKKVAENFVFHGKKYYGIEDSSSRRIDTVSLVKSIGNKISDDNSNPLSLAIADYGTGKSHLLVTLAQLLSGPSYMPETFNTVINNINKIDTSDGQEILKLYSGKNLVLVINGMRDFNLHSELLKAAQKTLTVHGVSDEKLRKINKSIEIAETFFERNYSLFQDTFNSVAKKYGWRETNEALSEKLRTSILSDDIAFDIINEVYEQTTGHKIRWDEGLSATNILEELVNDYCGINGNFDSVVILFDEFGRYLEYASSVDAGKSGDSALQQIFECTQNFEGKLHVINFIQSDIKTYLQRVDNTKNISRYIGRYDISDKYYISSNLETVFANLIHRKDKDGFKTFVIDKQNDLEETWKSIFESLNKWCTTSGLWSDYSLFRNVIVEGIYPMHPISTFMLSQLSDYLQNRSSLTLISHYINSMSDTDISGDYVSVLPEELMKGDLFTEMLSAEQEGKQTSQHCIRFYNVLRKYDDKLSESQFRVLRANLVMRILRCRTTSLEEVLTGLAMCSGISVDEVERIVSYLENEYGILGYDERACCFDFMEESNGAHDYKIIKKRLLASAVFDPYLLRNNMEILQLTGDDTNIDTNFGVMNRITSIEWQFKQQLYCAEDITGKLIDSYISEWKLAVDPDKPKGQLIWVYVCKETKSEIIEQIKGYSKKVIGLPIYLMMLNDADNRLNNDLIEFSVLKAMDNDIKLRYERHYDDDVNQNKERIKTEFNNLKRERLYFSPEGIKNFTGRLSKELSSVFETIYPKAVSFNYDALITAKKNIAPKSTKNFFTIVQMLLMNDVNENAIHIQPIEVRNRIDGLLFYRSNTSWKCINSEYHIVPPEDAKAREIYDYLNALLEKNEEISCQNIYDLFTAPPFGLNTYSFVLAVSVFLANLDYCTRLSYNGKIYSSKAWRNLLFVKEGKVEFDILLQSTIIKVDAGATEEKFLRLFKEIDDNKNVDKVARLDTELSDLLEENVIPERLEDALKLAQKTISDGINARNEWVRFVASLNKSLNEMNARNIFTGLQALETISKNEYPAIFTKYKYQITNLLEGQITSIKCDIESLIDEYFDEFLGNTRCNEVERIGTFRNHNNRLVKMFRDLNMTEYAEVLSDHVAVELANIERVRDKQNLKNDCEVFFKKCHVTNYSTLLELKDYATENARLRKLFAQYKSFLGKDSERIGRQLENTAKLIEEEKNSIIDEIGNLFDDVYSLNDYQSLNKLINRCEAILKRGLPEQDEESIDELYTDLQSFKNDIDVVKVLIDDRSRFEMEASSIIQKYEDSESDITGDIVESIISGFRNQIDVKEQAWIDNYLCYKSEDIDNIYSWLEAIKTLPLFLSDNTIKTLKINIKKADKIISKNRIETAKHYYDLLSDEEKSIFAQLINGDIQ